MNKYTIVGYYRDNNQPFVGHIKAATPQQAAKQALEKAADQNLDLYVVEAFKGYRQGQLANETTVQLSGEETTITRDTCGRCGGYGGHEPGCSNA